MSNPNVEELAAAAKDGDRTALENLVEQIQDRVYGLALRMLWHPEDARDATQEILIRVITRLSSFRGESAFTTWLYRVASNYLIDVKRSRIEAHQATFEQFSKGLAMGLGPETPASQERNLLAEEIKIGCTLAMLLCLSRDVRITFILGDILKIDSQECQEILDISADAFRQRISRARKALLSFTKAHCGIVDRANPCLCTKQIENAKKTGYATPENLNFVSISGVAVPFEDMLEAIDILEEAERPVAVYRDHPDFAANIDPHEILGSLMQ